MNRWTAAFAGGLVWCLTGPAMAMNKAELIDAIASDAGVSVESTTKRLDAMLGGMAAALKEGRPVALTGFGTFTVNRQGVRFLSDRAIHCAGSLRPLAAPLHQAADSFFDIFTEAGERAGKGPDSFFDMIVDCRVKGRSLPDSFFDVFTRVEGGERIADSFFDVFTELEALNTGVDSFFDIYTDLHRSGQPDSFFDVFTEITAQMVDEALARTGGPTACRAAGKDALDRAALVVLAGGDAAAAATVDSFFDIIYEVAGGGEFVGLGSFGRFSAAPEDIRIRKRPGRIRTPAKNVVRFKAGKALSDKVN